MFYLVEVGGGEFPLTVLLSNELILNTFLDSLY